MIPDSPVSLGKEVERTRSDLFLEDARQLVKIKIMTANGYTCLMFQLLVKLIPCLILIEVMCVSGAVNLLPFHYVRCKNSSR